MDTTFTEAEKRFVLAEILKASNLDLSLLVSFVKHHQVEPDWLSMQVPYGRTIRQCITATEGLLQQHIPLPNLKRKNPGDFVEIAPKRPVIEHQPPVAIPRSIQPRPSNGYVPTPSPTIAKSAPPTAKRRGRPPNALKEAQAREAKARASLSQQAQPPKLPRYNPPTATSVGPIAPLPPISIVQEYTTAPSPNQSYAMASSAVDDTATRKRGRPPLPKNQQVGTLQETRPSDSNVQWQAGNSEAVENPILDSSDKSYQHPPRQVSSPVEPKQQLPSIRNSIPQHRPVD